jgi:GT2 family glycosyltransferase
MSSAEDLHPESRLSVVIPSHNTAELTLRCLETVLAANPFSNPQALEVLVVDDASSDGTAQSIEERFPQVRVLRRDESGSFTVAANQGMAASRGEILLLLNSDTEVEADSLAALVQAFEDDSALGIAGARLFFANGQPQWSGGKEPGLLWFFALASGLPAALRKYRLYRRIRPVSGSAGAEVDWVTGAALAIRRSLWQRLSPFDERFRFYAQDLDLCSQARAAGWRVAVLPGFRVLHHQGATVATLAEGRRQDVLRLWTDLLIWAGLRKGASWARWAGRALVFGGRLRLGARRVRALTLQGQARRAWKRETEALSTALAQLRSPGRS